MRERKQDCLIIYFRIISIIRLYKYVVAAYSIKIIIHEGRDRLQNARDNAAKVWESIARQ